jgi:hypothetical protein
VLEALWPILDKHHSPPTVGEEKMMNFDAFVAAGEKGRVLAADGEREGCGRRW